MANDAAKLPEVDANKRLNADVGAEMDYLEAENAKAAAKIKEAEADVAKELDKWMSDERQDDKRVSRKLGLFDYPDPTYVPEFLYRKDGTKVRTIPQGFRHRWVRALGNRSRIAAMRARGYRPLFYDDICKDTDHDWERFGVEGWILNGDTVLMVIEERRAQEWDDLVQQRRDLFDKEAEEHMAELGDRYGVPTFRESGGKREFS